MVQHKMKKKVSLPSGVKQKPKTKVKKQQGPKKGRQLTIAPKKPAAVQQAKMDAEVTRTINERNEHLLKDRSLRDVGKSGTSWLFTVLFYACSIQLYALFF